MIPRIISIHGSSSEITFECEDIRLKASGEFSAKDDRIAGFIVSKASLKYENGERLSPDEQEELIRQYEKYASQPHVRKNWYLSFE